MNYFYFYYNWNAASQEYFTKKMFSICDKDKSNSISLQEFCESLGKLMKQSDNEDEMAKINKDKLHFLFRIYDDDGLCSPAVPSLMN